MKNSPLVLHFPSSCALSEQFDLLEKLNPEIRLKLKADKQLWIFEKDFSFDEVEFVDLKIPDNQYITYQKLVALEKNYEHYRLEQTPKKVTIIMGTSGLIGFLTLAVLGSIYVWISKTNKGRGYAETTPYKFKDEAGNVVKKESDASYISFEDCLEEVQNQWLGKPIEIAPTFAVEIVSAKYGTKPAKKKMEEVWMYHGSKVGIVICPFTEKIYVYDQKGKSEQSIYDVFQHPDLEGCLGDFSKEAKNIQQNLKQKKK